MTPSLFDRSRLSAREDAILEAAIEGMTDVQIAQRLEISPSTVNSYWVRIRGKLGQLSRTELVALTLKAKAKTDLEAVNVRLAALQQATAHHVRLTSDYTNAEILHAALDALPEATLVTCDRGLIRYANDRLDAMFGYASGELIDQSVAVLVPLGEREAERGRIAEFTRGPYPLRLGLDRVVYGRRRDGSLIRIVLLIDSRPTSTGPIFTCLVRDFVSEIKTRRRLVSTWS